MTPQEFVDKWKRIEQKERSVAQSHFNDLCDLLDVPQPLDDDPDGERYCFERGAEKSGGGDGWADVWRRGCFGWEYKGPRKNLEAAYAQLQLYRESLDNPPLLIVSDVKTIVVHTNFTNSAKRVVTFSLERLLEPGAIEHLRAAWTDPEKFRAKETVEAVTAKAAAQFAQLADTLRAQGVNTQRAAHFLVRLLFCLFAEDAGLLPKGLFSKIVEGARRKPSLFNAQLRQLFTAMAEGTSFGADEITHINGKLFDSDEVIDLDGDGIWRLWEACELWIGRRLSRRS